MGLWFASTLQIVIGIYSIILTNHLSKENVSFIFLFFLGLFSLSSLSWHSQTCLMIVSELINTQVLPILLRFFLSWRLLSLGNRPNWRRLPWLWCSWLDSIHLRFTSLGILRSIHDLYEAAYIDGANAWQKFRNITFPMILAVAAPTLISQHTFNFNNLYHVPLQRRGPSSWWSWQWYLDLMDLPFETGTSPILYGGSCYMIISTHHISISMIAFKKLYAFDMEDV